VKIEEMASKPDKIHDIYEQCPIRKKTYYLIDDGGKLRVHLYKVQHELFGKENWLPFLARYVEGEFKVEGDQSYDKWGARFNGKGGYKDLQVIEEWK
jgi:hypothetical protein